MLKGIIAITGKPGLYHLVSRGRNTLIVENIATGKRMPTYPHEKVVSLADITMYTDEGDKPLGEVLEAIKEYTGCKPVDVKALANDQAFRELFGKILPTYDKERVYTTDIKKLFSWYNQLVAADVTDFKDEEIAQDEAAEAAEAADAEHTK